MTSRPHDETLDEPPAKRQKTEEEQIEQCSNFWFHRGDFVLVASMKMAFRIHSDVLGRKSKVFHDMLNLPGVPRPDSEEIMDGCPLVHITDCPDDFKIFLGLIYDGFEQYQEYMDSPSWITVKVMLILGDKYDVPRMREEGFRQLRSWYAKDIDEWDVRSHDFFPGEGQSCHLDVAKITRTLNDSDLHAAVLYECCDAPTTEIVSGHNALCHDDLIRVFDFVRLTPRILYTLASHLLTDSNGKTLGCKNCAITCDEIQERAARYVAEHLHAEANAYLELYIWNELREKHVEGKLCSECVLLYDDNLRRLRQEQRDKLAEYLDLLSI